MKQYFTFLLLLIALNSAAQNIGVGTKKPLSKLHVAGDLRIDSLASTKHRGIVLHDSLGVVHSLSLTGKKSDVLRGDGTFSTLASSAGLADPSWLTTGNSGIDTAINFLGTLDKANLRFIVNKTPAGYLGWNTGNAVYGLNAMPADGGWSNVAIGSSALKLNTVGRNLVAVGDSALFHQTTNPQDVYSNTAIGSKSLYWNTTGSTNSALGAFASYYNTTGRGNTSFGYAALYSNSSGLENTALGTNALRENKGNGNVAVGANALYLNNTGTRNIAIGRAALYSTKTATDVIAIGDSALYSLPTNDDQQRINLAIGTKALFSNLTGNLNVGIGYRALHANTSGGCNTASGANALSSNTTGYDNTAFGFLALSSNTTSTSNTAVGSWAIPGITKGGGNTSIGAWTMFQFKSGSTNTVLGYDALSGADSGSYNVAIGGSALNHLTYASNNTAVGHEALDYTDVGSGNVALGAQALGSNHNGSNNTGIGTNSNVSSGNLTNATAIGYGTIVNASNKVRIGNTAVTKIEGQVGFTTPSDGRYKFNIREDVGGLDFIMKLRPVTYQFDVKRMETSMGGNVNDISQVAYDEATQLRRTGFIAQEVEKAASATNFNFSGINKPDSESDHYSLSYESFVVPLVKAVQDQQAMINHLIENNKKQQEEMNILMQEIIKLKQAGKTN